MFRPMWAHWRHLANMIKLPKWQIVWFSHFCTAHGSVVRYIDATWWIRLNSCFLRPTRVHNPNVKSIGSAVSAQLMAESPYALQ